MDAVLPIEVEILSLWILREAELEETEWVEGRCVQLNLIDEHRLQAMHHTQCYQKRMARSYQKRVRPRSFVPGDLVFEPSTSMTVEANSDPTGVARSSSNESSQGAQLSCKTWIRMSYQSQSMLAT